MIAPSELERILTIILLIVLAGMAIALIMEMGDISECDRRVNASLQACQDQLHAAGQTLAQCKAVIGTPGLNLSGWEAVK